MESHRSRHMDRRSRDTVRMQSNNPAHKRMTVGTVAGVVLRTATGYVALRTTTGVALIIVRPQVCTGVAPPGLLHFAQSERFIHRFVQEHRNLTLVLIPCGHIPL